MYKKKLFVWIASDGLVFMLTMCVYVTASFDNNNVFFCIVVPTQHIRVQFFFQIISIYGYMAHYLFVFYIFSIFVFASYMPIRIMESSLS